MCVAMEVGSMPHSQEAERSARCRERLVQMGGEKPGCRHKGLQDAWGCSPEHQGRLGSSAFSSDDGEPWSVLKEWLLQTHDCSCEGGLEGLKTRVVLRDGESSR